MVFRWSLTLTGQSSPLISISCQRWSTFYRETKNVKTNRYKVGKERRNRVKMLKKFIVTEKNPCPVATRYATNQYTLYSSGVHLFIAVWPEDVSSDPTQLKAGVNVNLNEI